MVLMACLLLFVTLSACSTNKSEKADKKAEDVKTATEMKNEKQMPGIKIITQKINKVKDDSVNTSKKQLMKITLLIENTSKKSMGVSPVPFYLKDSQNKVTTFYGPLNEFGKELKAGKSTKGTIYYLINKNNESYKLIYNPSAIGKKEKDLKDDAKDKKITWNLGKIIEKDYAK